MCFPVGVAGRAVVSELVVAPCVVFVSCSDTNSIMDVYRKDTWVPGIGGFHCWWGRWNVKRMSIVVFWDSGDCCFAEDVT